MKKEIAVISIVGWLLIVLAITSCGPIVPNRPGPKGYKGDPGTNGHSALIEQLPAGDNCPADGSILVTAVDVNDNYGIDAEDENIQTSTICNGVNGTNGQDGEDGVDGQDGIDASFTPFTPVKVVVACPANTSAYREVLLVLANGSVLASFSENVEGRNTRLSLIPDGSYANTDSSGCTFTISTSGSVRTVSWSGGSESWNLQ